MYDGLVYEGISETQEPSGFLEQTLKVPVQLSTHLFLNIVREQLAIEIAISFVILIFPTSI